MRIVSEEEHIDLICLIFMGGFNEYFNKRLFCLVLCPIVTNARFLSRLSAHPLQTLYLVFGSSVPLF